MKKKIIVSLLLAIISSLTACGGNASTSLDDLSDEELQSIISAAQNQLNQNSQSNHDQTDTDHTDQIDDNSSAPVNNEMVTTEFYINTDWTSNPKEFTEDQIESLQCIHDMSLMLHWETDKTQGLENQWLCITGIETGSTDPEWWTIYGNMTYSFINEEEFNKAITESPVTVIGYYDGNYFGEITNCIYLDAELHEENITEVEYPIEFADVAGEFEANEFAFASNYEGRQMVIRNARISNISYDSVWIDPGLDNYNESIFCYTDLETLKTVNANLPCTVIGTIAVAPSGAFSFRNCTFEQEN